MNDGITWKRPLKETKAERAAELRQSMIAGTLIASLMAILPGAIMMGVSEHSSILVLKLFIELTAGTAVLFAVFYYALLGLLNLLVPKCSIQANGVRTRGDLWSWKKLSGYNITTSREVPGAMDINFCHTGFKMWVSVPFLSSDVDENALREIIGGHVPYMELPEDNPSPFARPDPTNNKVVNSMRCTAVWTLVLGSGLWWGLTHGADSTVYSVLRPLFALAFTGSALLFGLDVVRYVRLRLQH